MALAQIQTAVVIDTRGEPGILSSTKPGDSLPLGWVVGGLRVPHSISWEGKLFLKILTDDWVNNAACRDAEDPTLWTAEKSRKGQRDKRAEAKLLCNSICPVRSYCFQWAMDNKEPVGIWGGTDPEERKELLNS